MKPAGSVILPAFWLAAALALAAGDVAGQARSGGSSVIYSCSDADGRVISSDRPIAACARRPMRELNSDGSLRRLIAPPLTPEEEREQAAQEKQREEEAQRRRAQQSRDRNLLLTFEDERALEAMRRRALAEIDREIQVATNRILALDKQLKRAQATAADWSSRNPGKPLPGGHQQQITDAANAILVEDALITDRHLERDQVNRRFDADAARLRELLGNHPGGDERARSPRS